MTIRAASVGSRVGSLRIGSAVARQGGNDTTVVTGVAASQDFAERFLECCAACDQDVGVVVDHLGGVEFLHGGLDFGFAWTIRDACHAASFSGLVAAIAGQRLASLWPYGASGLK